MANIEILRNELNAAIDSNNKKQILQISRHLDIEIMKYIKGTEEYQQILAKKRLPLKIINQE
jgi:hypothetical protein